MSKPVEPEHSSSFEYKHLYQQYQSAIDELKAAKEALSAATKQGIAHFNDCPGSDYDEDTDCTCGMVKTEIMAFEAIKRIDKFLKDNE